MLPKTRVRCPGCRNILRCDSSLAGTQAECPGCHTTLAVPEPRYTLVDLGALDGRASRAVAINNRGQIAGDAAAHLSHGGPAAYHPFLWFEGTLADIAPHAVAGSYDPRTSNLHATAMNGHAHVVGTQDKPGGGHAAFFFSSEAGTVFLRGGYRLGARADGINDQGRIVGSMAEQSSRGNSLPILWPTHTDTPMQLRIRDQTFFGAATGINTRSDVVGWLGECGEPPRGFLLTGRGRLIELGTLGGDKSHPVDISEHSHVVGHATNADGHALPFLWRDGAMEAIGDVPDTGSPDGRAAAVNRFDEIVGHFGEGDYVVPFLWVDGVTVDLRELVPREHRWTLGPPRDINDLGQIVGAAKFGDESHGYLLTPEF